MATIIVQETDTDVLDILFYILQEGGYDVYPLLHCEDDFLNIIEETKPHVVILDYRLKGEKCLVVLKSIKNRYPYLPVIATSCNSNINEIYDKAGFDDYVAKPFDIENLFLTLRNYIPDTSL